MTSASQREAWLAINHRHLAHELYEPLDGVGVPVREERHLVHEVMTHLGVHDVGFE